MKEEHPKGMHYIEKCRTCGTVIAQCSCVDPYKVIFYSVCEECIWEVVPTKGIIPNPNLDHQDRRMKGVVNRRLGRK